MTQSSRLPRRVTYPSSVRFPKGRPHPGDTGRTDVPSSRDRTSSRRSDTASYQRASRTVRPVMMHRGDVVRRHSAGEPAYSSGARSAEPVVRRQARTRSRSASFLRLDVGDESRGRVTGEGRTSLGHDVRRLGCIVSRRRRLSSRRWCRDPRRPALPRIRSDRGIGEFCGDPVTRSFGKP
jgi:hypothetical protein